MKITRLNAALQHTRKKHGNLTVAHEKPLGFMAMRDVQVVQIPPYGTLRNVAPPMEALADGQLVVIIQAQ